MTEEALPPRVIAVFCSVHPATIEIWLRGRAGQTSYIGDFIAYWLRGLLFFEAPAWVFTVCYSAFGALVLLSWFGVRPRPLFCTAA